MAKPVPWLPAKLAQDEASKSPSDSSDLEWFNKCNQSVPTAKEKVRFLHWLTFSTLVVGQPFLAPVLIWHRPTPTPPATFDGK